VDVATGEEKASADHGRPPGGRSRVSPTCSCVAFHGNHLVVTGCSDGTVRLWDVKGRKQAGVRLTR
jgi:WD40 repeat protein